MKAHLQNRIRQLATSWVVAAGLLLTGPGAAMAASIFFDDTAANEKVTVSANDFEGSFAANGIFFQGGLNNPQSVTSPEAQPITFFGTWLTPGAAQQSGTRTIYLVEASAPNLVSDIFTYNWSISPGPNGGSQIDGSFRSDVRDNLGTLPVGIDPSNVFVEGIRPVLFSLPFLSGALISDVEPVPVPGSLGLLALGLIWAPLLRRAGAGKD